jgi:gliding motility-associated-like protein
MYRFLPKIQIYNFQLICLLINFFSSYSIKAQMVGADAYIKATSVEVGINGAGGYEGVDMTVSVPLAGMHQRSGTSNYFGFVANPLVNGWASYDGDFFTPGTPENGWGIQIGNASGNVSGAGGFSNSCSNANFIGTQVEIPGSITNWSHNLSCYSSDWQGNLVAPAQGTNAAVNLHFKINYFLQQNDLYYTTTISITNNAPAAIPDFYYYRSLDPDNNVTLNSNYATLNTIEDQPGSGGCGNIACVSAQQSSPNNSYLGLAAVGANFRVTSGGFINRNGSDIWNGINSLNGTVGYNNGTADDAISLAYRIQNFAAGSTQTFKFVTILKASDKAVAINNLLYLSYPNSANLPPSVCTPGVDTVSACGGSVPIQISGPNTADFTWAWTPTTGLSTAVGPNTVASPIGIQTYTLLGTPTSTCVVPVSYVFVVKPITGVTFTTTATSNSPLCAGSTLSLSSTGGVSYSWAGPNGFTSSIQSPTIPNLPPSGIGNYTVTVTNAAGCSVTNSVTVMSSSTPTVVLGSNAPLCAGSTMSLTATGGSNYTWSGSNAFTSSLQNPTIANTTTLNSGVYTVTVTAAGSTCAGINTISIAVNTSPTGTVSVNTPLCSGNTLSLTTTAGTGYTYAWTGPNAFISSIQNPTIANIQVTDAGVYTIVTTASTSCTKTNTITVVVNATPTITIGSNSPICAGTTLSLTSTGGGTYTWSGPNAFTSTLQNPMVLNTSLSNSGVYNLTVTTLGSPCSSTANVSVSVLPTTTIAINPYSTICNNGTINLVAPSGGNSYTWAGPNAYSSSVQNPTLTNVGSINQGVYSLSVTTGGCLNTGTVSITIYNPLGFSILPVDATVCIGKTGTLSATSIGGSGSYNYSWSPPQGLASPNSSSTSFTGIATTNYTVTVIDANCAITTSITATVDVNVNPSPVITFTTSKARGCEPFCTDLTSISIPASANCVWSFSNHTGLTACSTPSFCFGTHGIYSASLTVTDINGCVDSVSQNAFIVVDPKPSPNFDWTPNNPNIIINEVTFTDQSTIGLPMTAWQWNFGDNYVPFQNDTSYKQNPVHLYNNVDNYPVKLIVTNSFGCTDSIIKLLPIEDDYVIYIPNSFTPINQDGKNDVFNVQGMGFTNDGFEMAIFDRWGTLVFKSNDVNKGWDGTIKGTIAKQDVYVYKIKVKDYKNRAKEYVGHVTTL